MTRYLIEDEPTGLEEHLDFEAGAEDMELRAMRLEAERNNELEAYWDALEATLEGEVAYAPESAQEPEDAFYEALEAKEQAKQLEARREATEAYYELYPDERAMAFADEIEGDDLPF